MLRSLLSIICLVTVHSQYIGITICSDSNCNTNCVFQITTNGKCTDSNPNSITTLNSYSQFTNAHCDTLIPNTYKTPIILDNNCNQLYLYGNDISPISYRAYNLSLLIGVCFFILFIFIILIGCIIRCCRLYLCLKKSNNYTLPNIENQSPNEYGYRLNLPPYNLYPPPPPYIAPPPPYIAPPQPSAPEYYNEKII